MAHIRIGVPSTFNNQNESYISCKVPGMSDIQLTTELFTSLINLVFFCIFRSTRMKGRLVDVSFNIQHYRET